LLHGLAGPVQKGPSRHTNLNWRLDSQHRARAGGHPRVALVNDVAVVGWGLSAHGLATGVAGIGASLVAVTLLYGALLAPQLRSAVGLS
ncbi:MAG: glucokinase, partial [Cyanobacteriota bacterium]